MNKPKLCYVEGQWAFFTTQPIDKQWGDDWDDAPYEHNAGDPYEWRENQLDREPWEIFRVAWLADMDTPADRAGHNSTYSVEHINRGDVAWLAPSRWSAKTAKPIYAGCSLVEFASRIQACGGELFLPVEFSDGNEPHYCGETGSVIRKESDVHGRSVYVEVPCPGCPDCRSKEDGSDEG